MVGPTGPHFAHSHNAIQLNKRSRTQARTQEDWNEWERRVKSAEELPHHLPPAAHPHIAISIVNTEIQKQLRKTTAQPATRRRGGKKNG